MTLFCADCGIPYPENPFERRLCHSGDMLSTEPPSPQDSWYPVRRFEFSDITYYLYEAPRILIRR